MLSDHWTAFVCPKGKSLQSCNLSPSLLNTAVTLDLLQPSLKRRYKMAPPRKPSATVSIGSRSRGVAKRSDWIPGSSESDAYTLQSWKSPSSDAARRKAEPTDKCRLASRLHLRSVITSSTHYFHLLTTPSWISLTVTQGATRIMIFNTLALVRPGG